MDPSGIVPAKGHVDTVCRRQKRLRNSCRRLVLCRIRLDENGVVFLAKLLLIVVALRQENVRILIPVRYRTHAIARLQRLAQLYFHVLERFRRLSVGHQSNLVVAFKIKVFSVRILTDRPVDLRLSGLSLP